jgi:hypothetical protein
VPGLRREERLGSRWIDLDLDLGEGVAHPRKQLQRQRQKGKELVLVDLKTEASKGALLSPLAPGEALRSTAGAAALHPALA